MSTRHKIGTLPTREPTEEDCKWGAELFTTSLKFVRYNRDYILQFHTNNMDTIDRLVLVFGGGAYQVPGTNSCRYRLTKQLMLDFLDKIQPYLGTLAGQRLLALADLLDARERAANRAIVSRDIDFFTRETARQKAIAENAPEK